jgi:hypothetical protein
VRQVKNKVKSICIIFFDIKGIILKEFAMVGQTANSAYYCDVLQRLKMCEDFAPNFGDKRTGCCITTHDLTLPFSPGNVLLKTI